LNAPGNVYTYWKKDSNEASEQLVAWTAGNLWPHEPFVDDMTGLIIGVQYNTQTTLSANLAVVMARVKPIAIKYGLFLNPFATNAVKTAQIHSWWYAEIARIDPAHKNSDPAHAYMSVVNESSQRLFSLLTLYVKLLQRLLALLQQWYTAARSELTLLTDYEFSCLQRSAEW